MLAPPWPGAGCRRPFAANLDLVNPRRATCDSPIPRSTMPRRTIAFVVAGFAAALISLLTTAQPAAAHGFSSTVYVNVTGDTNGHVHTALELEYDLFVVSAADSQKNDALFRAGTDAYEAQDASAQAAALNPYADSASKSVAAGF